MPKSLRSSASLCLALLGSSLALTTAMPRAHAQFDPGALTGLPLTGKVVGPDGTPLAGVPVYVLIKSPVTIMDPATHQNSYTTQLNGQTVQSDAKGQYGVQGVKPGDTVAIFVSKPGYRYVSGGMVTSGFDSYRASDLIVSPPTAIIAGKVLDPSGNPVPGAAVIAPASNLELQGTTDPTGQFVLEGLPSGSTDVLAMTRSGFGHVVADTGTNGLTVTLSPVTLPTAQDVQRGTSILRDVQKASYGTTYTARDLISFELAPYDLDAALGFAGQDTTPSDSVLLGLVTAAASGDVVKAAPTVSTILDRIVDPGQKALGAAIFGRELALVQPDLARPLAEKAKAWVRQSPIERYGGVDRMAVAGFLGRLKDRDGAKMADDTVKAMIDGAKSVNKGNPAGAAEIINSLLGQYAETVAPGGLAFIDKVINQLPEVVGTSPKFFPRIMPRMSAATVLAHYDVAEAATLLKRAQSGEIGTPVYGQAAVAVVEQLGKTDPAGALAVARLVTDQDHKAIALALAAKAQPQGTATQVWNDAIAAALTCPQRSSLTGWVASLARSVDPAIGANLFAMAWGTLRQQVRLPGGLSAFMFYYSQIDPGQARLISEKEYAIAQMGARVANDPSIILPSILAMSAVDTDRALAMASSADGDAQYISKRKIAQYVMLPASGKATLRFDRWMVPDTWLPGTPVER